MLYRQLDTKGSKKKSERDSGDGNKDIDFEYIESVMYGELNYKEWELWETTWVGVILSIQGLRNKDYVFESIMRRVAAACVGSGSNKKLAQQFATSFWPDSRKKKRNTILDPKSPQARQLARFKEIEAAKNLINKK